MSSEQFELDNETITGDVSHTIERMPEVSAHFNPGAATETAPASAPPATPITGEVDSAGVVWNADLHSATKTKNAKGEWRRKRQSRAVSGVAQATAVVDPNALTAEQIDKCKANGRMIAETQFMLFQAVFGKDEWRPEDDEHKRLCAAWEECAVACKWHRSSPLLAPIIATAVYAAPRFTKPGPQTLSRMERVKVWFAGKVLAFKQKRAEKNAAKNPNAPREVPKE